MFGKFKSDQLFVEKTKLANNFYEESRNHVSWIKPPTHYVQQLISQIAKENNDFKFYVFFDVGRIWKSSIVCRKNKTQKQFACRNLDLKWQYIYKYHKVIHGNMFTKLSIYYYLLATIKQGVQKDRFLCHI